MMAMPVMQVRPVRVGVHNRLVRVRVHMRLLRRQVRVIVRVVGVVVSVPWLMLFAISSLVVAPATQELQPYRLGNRSVQVQVTSIGNPRDRHSGYPSSRRLAFNPFRRNCATASKASTQ